MWVSDSYEDLYIRAEASFHTGDYEYALDKFQRLSKRLAKLKPEMFDRRPELRGLQELCLAKEAKIYHIQGEFDRALELYQRLTEMTPATATLWRRYAALVRIDMGQTEAGLDELRAQAAANPSDSRLWLAIGLECEALGRLEEAEENLQRAARSALDPDAQAEAYLALFDFYRTQGRVDEALSAWEQAWAVHGHDPGYVFPLYQMMWEVGDLEQAHKYLRQEQNPLRKGFYQGLLAVSEGKPNEAIKHWKRVAKMNPLEFDEGHEAWAEAALRVDHPPEKIIAVLGDLMEEEGLSPREFLMQAIAEARLGHTDHAEAVLQTMRATQLSARPRREKLSASHWALFDELVADEEIKRQLRHYFEDGTEGGTEAET